MTATPLVSFGQVALFLSLVGSGSSAEQASHAKFSITVKIQAGADVYPPSPLKVSTDKHICGEWRSPQSLMIDRDRNLKNAVVWLESTQLKSWDNTQRESSSETILEDQCEFSPRLVVIRPTDSVNFLNRDNILHGVRTKGVANPTVNRVHPPNLNKVEIKFSKPEIVPVACDLHPWMKAFVVVAPHPYYQISDANGQVVFKNLSPGTYQVKLWHEILGSKTLSEPTKITHQSVVIRIPWGFNSESPR